MQVILDWDFTFQGRVLRNAVLLPHDLSLQIDPTQALCICVLYMKNCLLPRSTIIVHSLAHTLIMRLIRLPYFAGSAWPPPFSSHFISTCCHLQSWLGTFPNTLVVTWSLDTWVHSFSRLVHAHKVLFCPAFWIWCTPSQPMNSRG